VPAHVVGQRRLEAAHHARRIFQARAHARGQLIADRRGQRVVVDRDELVQGAELDHGEKDSVPDVREQGYVPGMDERLRTLERKWQQSGSADDLAAYLAERLRAERNLVDKLMRRMIRLERAVRRARFNEAAYIQPVTDQEILDWLDEDMPLELDHPGELTIPGSGGGGSIHFRAGAGPTPPQNNLGHMLPPISVPSVFTEQPAPMGQLTISDPGGDPVVGHLVGADSTTTIHPAEEVPLHAHFSCMMPGCYQHVTENLDATDDLSWVTPSGWQRSGDILLCGYHINQGGEACLRMGGHIRPTWMTEQTGTYQCDRCNDSIWG
jgi:hypothetical protein